MDLPTAKTPPFPEGHESPEGTPHALDAFDTSALDRSQRRSSLVVLWSCVVAFVIITLGLLRADTVVYNATNSDDIGPIDGLNAFLIVVVGIGFGLLPLTLAIWHSAAVARRRPSRTRRAAGIAAMYTAACGAVTTPVWIHLNSENDGRRIRASALAEATHIYLALGLVALVPILILVVSLRSNRNRPERRPTT